MKKGKNLFDIGILTKQELILGRDKNIEEHISRIKYNDKVFYIKNTKKAKRIFCKDGQWFIEWEEID